MNLTQANQNILVGGDLNFCLDPVLDKSKLDLVRSKAAKRTLMLMKDLNLVDVWRRLHPRDRDYSFYSTRHKTYSRIDYFLMSRHIQERVISSDYKPRILSDHSPLTLEITMPDKEKDVYRWRLNMTLLNRADFVEFINKHIKEFLDFNLGSVDDKFIIWETLKAYLRGQIISFTSGVKKEYNQEVDTLEKGIGILEKELQRRYVADKKELVDKNYVSIHCRHIEQRD